MTGLDYVSGLALDQNGNLYVANRYNSSITVYAAGATGNVAPTRRLRGSLYGAKLSRGTRSGFEGERLRGQQ